MFKVELFTMAKQLKTSQLFINRGLFKQIVIYSYKKEYAAILVKVMTTVVKNKTKNVHMIEVSFSLTFSPT